MGRKAGFLGGEAEGFSEVAAPHDEIFLDSLYHKHNLDCLRYSELFAAPIGISDTRF